MKNPKYRPNKKNGGIAPHYKDPRVAYVPIGCTHCMECMKQKANAWRLRLMEDIKENTNAKFITLTYSNKSYTKLAKEVLTKKDVKGYLLDNEIATLSVRYFLERWRKKNKKSVRHWLIPELGQTNTEHLHIHGLIWTNDVNEIEERWNAGKYEYGYVWKGKRKGNRIINYVSDKTINYITKYCTKIDLKHRYYKPKILTSPGIGANYIHTYNYKLNKFNGRKTKTTYTTRTGQEYNLPIYWRNKRYSEEEREKLWIYKLDENIRYVMGEKVNADNEKAYKKLIEHYRKINGQMGYGSPKDYNGADYEKARRRLKQEERFNNKRYYHGK